MAYGILPGVGRFWTWDMHLRSQDGDLDGVLFYASLKDLSVHDEAIEAIKRSNRDDRTEHGFSAFADILALWTDWVPLTGSICNTIFSPFNHRIYIMRFTKQEWYGGGYGRNRNARVRCYLSKQ
jgi:hypothetical protein